MSQEISRRREERFRVVFLKGKKERKEREWTCHFLDEPVSKAEALQEQNYDEIENIAHNQITKFELPIGF